MATPINKDTDVSNPLLMTGLAGISGQSDERSCSSSISNQTYKTFSSYNHDKSEFYRNQDAAEIKAAEILVSEAKYSRDTLRNSGSHIARNNLSQEAAHDIDFQIKRKYGTSKSRPLPADLTISKRKCCKVLNLQNVLVLWAIEIIPVATLLSLLPLLAHLAFENTKVGGIGFFWTRIAVWLEVIWLTFWLAKLLAKLLPWSVGLISSALTSDSKIWQDLGKALEVHTTMLLWVMASKISFLHIMKKCDFEKSSRTGDWKKIIDNVILTAIIGVILNFFEKIIIQIIAFQFNTRTCKYEKENEREILNLVKLFKYSKNIAMKNSDIEANSKTGSQKPISIFGMPTNLGSSSVNAASRTSTEDFADQAKQNDLDIKEVILELIQTNSGSLSLAGQFHRAFVQNGSETISADDLRKIFVGDEEGAEATISMFDKDSNKNITKEELEVVSYKIGRRHKKIIASIKDLGSVVSKLDKVFSFIVILITLFIFLCLVSTSASIILASAGTTFLALSWLFQQTAQEFLQSILFIFLKHPFDIGDRVTIYGNTGINDQGDDYFVEGISLLHTEFTKLNGQFVQVPNSYLNDIFIVNHRRSESLTETIPITVNSETTEEQIEKLRHSLVEFVAERKQDYQKTIFIEMIKIHDNRSISIDITFNHKHNSQFELPRLRQRNNFMWALMDSMRKHRIEGPQIPLTCADTT